MRTFDLTPLYRSTVGFDRVFDLLDNMGKAETGGYPPDVWHYPRYKMTIACRANGIDPESNQQSITSGTRCQVLPSLSKVMSSMALMMREILVLSSEIFDMAVDMSDMVFPVRSTVDRVSFMR